MAKVNLASLSKTIAAVMKDLSPRNRDIVSRRFGLRSGKPETLESIGSSYDITRERVRQIEASTMAQLAESVGDNRDISKYVTIVSGILERVGGVMRQDELFARVTGSGDANVANASLAFVLSLSNGLVRHDETDQFHPFWAMSENHVERFKTAAATLASSLARHGEVVKNDQLSQFVHGDEGSGVHAHLASVMSVSKEIGTNIYDEVGLRQWSQIRPRGVRDKAYLVMKKQGAPRHFSEIAKLINSASFVSGRSVNTQTVHNELIKDTRFVLVGRGLYALAEWGYKPGTVKDVLVDVLTRTSAPLTKVELVAKVLESRMVKENTILLNLQDSRVFAKNSDGTYTLRKA